MKVMKSGKDNRVIGNIVFDIKSDDVLTDQGKERFRKIFKMLTKEFVDMQYDRGQELIDFAKEKDLEFDDYILFPHKKGTALIRVGYYSRSKSKPDISPAIFFDSHDFLTGGTFSTGLFSDVHIIIEEGKNVFLYTRDIIPIHNLYLLWVMERLEKAYLDNNFEIKEVTFDSSYDRKRYELFNSLIPELNVALSINKSVRIDSLKIEEEGKELTMREYLIKNRIFKYINSDIEIVKACLLFGKPYNQVKKYVEKNGYCRNSFFAAI